MRSEQRDRRSERLVRVAIAENAAAARLIQDELEAAGIRSLLKNRDATALALGGAPPAPFTLEIFVLEGDADAASALLDGGPVPPGLPLPAHPPRSSKRRRWWR